MLNLCLQKDRLVFHYFNTYVFCMQLMKVKELSSSIEDRVENSDDSAQFSADCTAIIDSVPI